VESFILEPNLPEKAIKKAFVSCLLPKEMSDNLKSLGVEPIPLKPSKSLSTVLKTHPDIITFNAKPGLWLFEKENENLFDFCECHSRGVFLNDSYPDDCVFNMVSAGKALICGKRVWAYWEGLFTNNCFGLADRYKNIILVSQGYAKCSTIVVDKLSFITSDNSIFISLKSRGFNTLMVTNEGVLLGGYSNGFIGGCAGKISKDVLVFTGNIKAHKDYKNIKSFCGNVGVDIFSLSLSSDNLYDYGGILPVC